MEWATREEIDDARRLAEHGLELLLRVNWFGDSKPVAMYQIDNEIESINGWRDRNLPPIQRVGIDTSDIEFTDSQIVFQRSLRTIERCWVGERPNPFCHPDALRNRYATAHAAVTQWAEPFAHWLEGDKDPGTVVEAVERFQLKPGDAEKLSVQIVDEWRAAHEFLDSLPLTPEKQTVELGAASETASAEFAEVASRRRSVTDLLRDVALIRSALSGATWFPPDDPIDPDSAGYFHKDVTCSVELVAASHNLFTFCDAFDMPRESMSFSQWKDTAAEALRRGHDAIGYEYGRDCGTEEGPEEEVNSLAAVERKLNAMRMLGHEYPTRLSAENQHSRHNEDGLEGLVATIASRLNEADREVLQAVTNLGATPLRPVTNAAIAKALPGTLTADNMKQRTGPLWRHGILEKGSAGAGFYLSDFGSRVAAKVLSEVRTQERTEVDTD